MSPCISYHIPAYLSIPDEQLQSLLVLRIKNPAGEPAADPSNPPEILLDLLSHIQVSLEATYISPIPSAVDTPRTSRLLQTPRTGALGRPTGRLNPHPSILPPSTPNPMPSTADQDRKYTTAEGTILVANIWGSSTADDSPEDFALLWSEKDKSWVAIYRMAITVCMFIKISIEKSSLKSLHSVFKADF